MAKTSKPQYRTLVSALGNLCNAVHDELEGTGELAEVRRRVRRSMERGDELVARAETAMAERARRKEDGDAQKQS